MVYLLPAAVVSSLGFMFWMVAFRLRSDRVRFAREVTRARFRYRPANLARFLLGRSFAIPHDPPEWERRLISSLRRLPPTDA